MNSIILQEGKRDEALAQFLPLFQKRGINISVSQLKQALLSKFVNEGGMHNLSLSSNFYLIGVAKYYFNRDLTSNPRLGILYGTKDKFNREICARLDALILILRNAYIDSVGTTWEQPEDFGEFSIDKLLKKYKSKIDTALGFKVKKVKEELPQEAIDTSTIASKKYTYEIMYSFEDCRKFCDATAPGSWCITYGLQHYNAYVKRLHIHYVVFMKKGYENIPRRTTKGYTKNKPHDEYGNSLICVLQSNTSPDPIFITSRWNHGSPQDGTQGTEADHAYTTEEFLNIVGCDYSVLERCFKQWQAKKSVKNNVDRSSLYNEKREALRKFKYAQMLINGGNRDYQSMFRSMSTLSGDQKKGPFIAAVEGNDCCYLTVYDRGKLYFDDFLYKSDYTYLNQYDAYPNFYILGSERVGNGKVYIYDMRRHCFLNIEGDTAFKYCSSHAAIKKSNYFIVGLSGNQFAMINSAAVKPINIHGRCWFERFTMFGGYPALTSTHVRGAIWLRQVPNEGICTFTYDSASGEEYNFNLTTKTLVPNEVIKDADGWELSTSTSKFMGKHAFFYKKVIDRQEIHGEYGNYIDTKYAHQFRDPNTNEPLSINGHNVFKNTEEKGFVTAYELFEDGKVHFYNFKFGKPVIMPNGVEFIGQGNNECRWLGIHAFDIMESYSDNPNTPFLTLNTNYQRNGNKEALYDSEHDIFFHDDAGRILFKSIGSYRDGFGHFHRDRVVFTPYVDGDSEIYTPEEILAIMKPKEVAVEQREIIKKQFDNILRKLMI